MTISRYTRIVLPVLMQCLIIAAGAFAQSPDTVRADQLRREAEAFAERAEWPRAIAALEASREACRAAGAWEAYVNRCFRLSRFHRYAGDFEQGMAQLEAVEKTIDRYLSRTDTLYAELYFHRGLFYYRHLGQYRKALDFTQKAWALAESTWGRLHAKSARILNQFGIIYRDLGDNDQADRYAAEVLDIRRQLFGENHLETAQAYNNIGVGKYRRTRYRESLAYYEKGMDIVLSLPETDSSILAMFALNIGGVYGQIGYYRKALEATHKALRYCPSQSIEDVISLGNIYNNLGTNYLMLGETSKAVHYFQQSLEKKEQAFGGNVPEVGQTLMNIGIAYDDLGKFEEAARCFEKARVVLEDNLDPDHHFIAMLNNSIGNLAFKQRDFDRAARHYQRSVDIQLANRNYLWAASNLVNLAALNLERQEYRKGLQYAAKADRCAARHPVAEDKVYVLSNNDYNKGLMYAGLEKYDDALANLNRSARLIIDRHGPDYYGLGRTFLGIAETYSAMGRYEEAVRYCDQALAVNTRETEQEKIIYDKFNHLQILDSKAAILEAWRRTDGRLQHLEAAEQLMAAADRLIKKMSRGYLAHSDRLSFNATVAAIYERAIENSRLLFEATGDEKHFARAFYYSERSKASILLQLIAEVRALKFANIPDSLLEREKDLRLYLTFYQQKRNEATGSGDTTSALYFEDQYFTTSRAYTELIRKLERDYPDYYRLKYASYIPDIAEIRSQLLEPGDMLVEYFVGDSSMYAFTLSEDAAALDRLGPAAGLEHQVDRLRRSLLPFEESVPESEFPALAHQLYRHLLATPLSRLSQTPRRLILVPSSVLGYLPFEVLLSQPVAEDVDYQSMPYLIRDYTVNYGYSSALLLENKGRSPVAAERLYGGFGPIYRAALDTSALSPEAVAIRSGLTDLPAARKNIAAIARLFNGDAFLNGEATEANFKAKAGGYSVLHLAMHGLVDDNNPLLSRLIFSSTPDPEEDNFLNAAELYNMQLNAQLAVLGACNTGYGEVSRGEGVLSLSRAFAYAGCSDLVASLWSVPDGSTATLMQRFFLELKEGHEKDEALRRAKLYYLDKVPARVATPFYWAGFINIGDASPLVEPPARSAWWWSLLLVPLFGFLLFRRRNGADDAG